MAHNLSGIITSFKYTGDLLNIVLVGNYHLIVFPRESGPNYRATILEPYDEMTKEIRKELKNLSFKGRCAYIETEYFGGPGEQRSETWENGVRIEGPLFSYDGTDSSKMPEGATLVEDSINQTLRTIGIYAHEGLDEFDSVRLGEFRGYRDVLEEYQEQRASK